MNYFVFHYVERHQRVIFWKRIPTKIRLLLIILFLAFIQFVYKKILLHYYRPETTVVIFYNRVPKCGSSLMNMLLSIVSNGGSSYKFVQSEDYDHFRLSVDSQNKLRDRLLDLAEQSYQRALVYERHVHFINFETKEKVLFYYINQIRDPLTRVLSNYDYIRYACLKHAAAGACPLASRSLINMTMEECLVSGDPGRCLTPGYGVSPVIPFFCGQSRICDDNIDHSDQEAALILAKLNIERHYSFIGILELIESSLELLEHTQPSLFGGIYETYLKTLNSSRIHETPRPYRRPVSQKALRILRNLLKYEYELYYFIRQRFTEQYSRTFHRMPRIDR